LDFSFENKEIRSICEDESMAVNIYAPAVIEKLKNRLTDMLAAKTVSEIPPIGNPREIKGAHHMHYAIDLCDGFQITFSANHVKIPLTQNGSMDWSKVSHIKILQITK
jgi:proteic killer suppression protein